MDIMELGAIGELVGGVAVVVTLVYVAVQVRHARYEVASAGIRSRGETAISVLQPVVDSEHLPKIWAKVGFQDFGDFGLTPEETVRRRVVSHLDAS